MRASIWLILVVTPFGQLIATAEGTGSDLTPTAEINPRTRADSCGDAMQRTRGWRVFRSRDGVLEMNSPGTLRLDSDQTDDGEMWRDPNERIELTLRATKRPASASDVNDSTQDLARQVGDSVRPVVLPQDEHRSCRALVAGQQVVVEIGRTEDFDHLWYVRSSLQWRGDSVLHVNLYTPIASKQSLLLAMLRSARIVQR